MLIIFIPILFQVRFAIQVPIVLQVQVQALHPLVLPFPLPFLRRLVLGQTRLDLSICSCLVPVDLLQEPQLFLLVPLPLVLRGDCVDFCFRESGKYAGYEGVGLHYLPVGGEEVG